MPQIGVDIGSYVFDASAKTITFSGVTINTIEQIKPIVNGTKGIVIFNPAVIGSFGTLSTNVLTLEYDTTLQDDTDSLYVCVNIPDAELATEATLSEVNIELQSLNTTETDSKNLLTLLNNKDFATETTLQYLSIVLQTRDLISEMIEAQNETNRILKKIYNHE